MMGEVKIKPWERLQRLCEMSELERPVYAKQWAIELASRYGAGSMPRYMLDAHRDTIAATLLSLVDEPASMPDHDDHGGGGSQSNGFAGPVGDVSRTDHRSDDVSPSVIRAWAQQRGIPVGDRGRIPLWVIKRYHAEHAAESESSLASKIRAALEQYGELTKSELWDILGRNHPSWKIEQAIESLPNVEVLKGRSSGGRPPMIFRLAEESSSSEIAEPTKVTVSSQRYSGDLRDVDDFVAIADEDPSGLGTADSKIHDFFQILRGESRSD